MGDDCDAEGHVHSEPVLEDLDDLWLAAIALTALEYQRQGELAGMHRGQAADFGPVKCATIGLKYGLLIARYWPVAADKLQLAVLESTTIAKVRGGDLSRVGDGMDVATSVAACGMAALLDEAGEVVADVRARERERDGEA